MTQELNILKAWKSVNFGSFVISLTECWETWHHLGNAETLKEGTFWLMIPIFKQNGLTWTLLNTSNIPNILWYSFDPTELARMESYEKKDLSL